MLPRGIRNNNPLNIRIGNQWRGKVPHPTDTEFEQFVSLFWGLRAAFVLLRRYIIRYHLTNLTEILHRWAPKSENDTRRYIEFVSGQTGIGALDEISFNDHERMIALVNAMILFENGMSVPSQEIENAYYFVRKSK